MRLAGDTEAVEWLWGGAGLQPHEPGAQLRAEVEPLWPGDSITLDAPDTFLARAFATRALLPGPLRGNLRGGVLAHAGAQARTRGSQMRSTVVLLVVGALLCGAVSGWEYKISARQDALKDQFGNRLSRIMGYTVKEKGAHAFLIAERELADRVERRKAMADALSPSLLSDLQLVLPGLGKLDMHIEHFALTAESLQIKGVSTGKSVAAPLRESLAGMGYVAVVTEGETKADGRVPFVLNATPEAAHE